jgi:hypothetical protein
MRGACRQFEARSDMNNATRTALLAAAMLTALSGCGNDPGTRALTGGAIGVGAAAVLGAPLLAGAAVGAVAGAVTTTPHDSHRHRDRDHDSD